MKTRSFYLIVLAVNLDVLITLEVSAFRKLTQTKFEVLQDSD